MVKVGRLSKMAVTPSVPVVYALVLDQEKVPLNAFLGKLIKLTFTQQIYCMGCQAPIKKSYQEGFCFPCTKKLARCDLCMLKPERCHFHLGTCREPQWGESVCMISHVVYLANSSGLKVGITRHSQVMNRWIDQGAIAAMPIFEVATRRISGLIEVILAKHVPDKTNWRKMLMGQNETLDLFEKWKDLEKKCQDDLKEIQAAFDQDAIKRIEEPKVYHFEYPVLTYPEKISSLSFDKTPIIEGRLLGMKGQYLILDSGVINIRRHSGYLVEVEVEPH